MTSLWLLVSAALLLAPDRAVRSPVGGRPQLVPLPRPGIRFAGVRRAVPLPVLSGALAVVACVALFGPHAGLPVALLAAPAVGVGVRVAGLRTTPLRVDRTVALTLDLTAAGLHSGRPLGEALAAAAPAAASEVSRALLGVAGLLRLGADPQQAWGTVASGALAPVAVTAIRSADSGIRAAAAFERLAVEIRAEVTAAAATRAHRAGVTAMAPLAACFLPSFVCLGIVPVVVGIARSALGIVA